MLQKVFKKYNNLPVAVRMTFWIFICMVVQRGISLLTVPLFTRLMSTEQFGEYSTFLSWESVFEIFVSFRLYAGVYNKGMNKFKDSRDEFALSMQYTVTILTIISLSLYSIFRTYINRVTGISTILTIGLFIELLMSTPMKFWSVKKRYEFDYKPIIIATLGLALLNPVIGLIAVNSSDNKGLARIISFILVQIIYGLGFYIYNLVKGHYKFNLQYSKFALLFNAPLIPHYLSEYILNSSDRIMIQKLVGYSEVALYSVAYNVGMMLTIVITSINQALVPWLYQELDSKNYSGIRTVTASIGYIIILPLMFFCILAPEMISLIGGKVYMEAIYVVPPVCASLFFIFWYTLCANVEFYYEKNKFTMYISIFGAVINVVLNALFIPAFGYVAAGYTTLFSYFIYGVGHLLFMDKVFFHNEGIHLFDFRIYFSQMIITIFVCISVSFFYHSLIIRSVYLLILIGLIIFNKNRILNILKLLRK